MYKTKYALLHLSRTYTNVHVYICIGSTCMYKGHLNMTVFIKARLAQYISQGCWSESHCGQEFFHFVFCRFRCAPDRSTGPIQMKSSMTFIRGI